MPIEEVSVPTDLYQIRRAVELDEEGNDPEAEPETRAQLFSFQAGDISDSDWSDLRNLMVSNGHVSSGRPRPPRGRVYSVPTPSVPNTSVAAVVGYEVPTMTSGRFLANVFNDSFNPHSMLRPRAPGVLDQAIYLYSRTIYKFTLEFELLDSVGWTNSVNWAILFQIWGQFAFPWGQPGFQTTNPPFSLAVDGDSYDDLNVEVQLYGSNATAPTSWEYAPPPFNAAISPTGSHTATVWWKKDHTGRDSRCKVVVDGDTICDVTNVKLGTPFDSDGKVATAEFASGGTPTFGVYTQRGNDGFASPGVQCYWDKFEIDVVESI